jgi:c-di-GMP-binding flagellar brake protein YcgR
MERRNFPRVEASNPVLYFPDLNPRPKIAWTVDLSLGGARIKPSHGLATGKSVWMHIAVYPETIKCRGRPVYVLPVNGSMAAGVKFEGLSEHDKLSLKQYLCDSKNGGYEG